MLRQAQQVDVVVFGAGIVGLWLARTLQKSGRSVLVLEKNGIGSGQTGQAQGIIHFGYQYAARERVPYTLLENLHSLPLTWHDHLAGKRYPSLSNVLNLADHFHIFFGDEALEENVVNIWQEAKLPFTREMLKTNQKLFAKFRSVYRVSGPIVDIGSLLRELALPMIENILLYDFSQSRIHCDRNGYVQGITICYDGYARRISTKVAVFSAGGGNVELLKACGYNHDVTQIRPLTMIMIEGKLPCLNFQHLTTMAGEGFTITSVPTTSYSCVWMIGGGIAEKAGVSPPDQIAAAKKALSRFWPEFFTQPLRATTFEASRFELRDDSAPGEIPCGPGLLSENNWLAIWPTKLTFTPLIVQKAMERITTLIGTKAKKFRSVKTNWPSPPIVLTHPYRFASGL